MAEEKIILFEVDFNTAASLEKTKELKEQLEKTKTEFDKFRENSKKAGIVLSDNDVVVLQHKANIKALEMQIRANENITLKLTQAQQANLNTIEQTRFALSAVSAQWAQEAKINGENTERAKELYEQKLLLTEALKKEEAATGDNRRNVGNYMASAEELGKQMKLLVSQMMAMSQAGKANSADFLELQKKLYETRDQINDLKDETITYNKEVKTLEFAIEIFNGLNDATNSVASGMKLAGVENKDFEKSIEKINEVMALMNGIQQVGNLLQKDSAAVVFLTNVQLKAQLLSTQLQTAAESKSIIVRYAAIAAQKALNLVMKANPVGLIITALTALAGVVYLFTGRTEEAAKKQARLNELQDAQIDIINRLIETNNRRSETSLQNLEKEIEMLKANGAESSVILAKEIELINKKIAANKNNALLIENERKNIATYEAAIEVASAKIQDLKNQRAKTDKTSAIEFYNTLIDNETEIIDINKARIERSKQVTDKQIALEVELASKRKELTTISSDEYLKGLQTEIDLFKEKYGQVNESRLLEQGYYEDRRNKVLDTYELEKKLIEEKKRLGVIKEKEYDLEKTKLGNDCNAQLIELDKKRLDVLTDNMSKEIELFKLKNKTLLKDDTELTNDLIEAENKRLQDIYDKEKAARDKKLELDKTYAKQYEIDELNSQNELEAAKAENRKKWQEKQIQDQEDFITRYNDLKMSLIKSGSYEEYQQQLTDNETKRQEQIAWAENYKNNTIMYNDLMYSINKKAFMNEFEIRAAHYNKINEAFGKFSSNMTDIAKKAFGESSGIAKDAAILEITIESASGQFAAFLSGVRSGLKPPFNFILGGALATQVLIKSIMAINDVKKISTPGGSTGTASTPSSSIGSTSGVSQTLSSANAGIVNREYTNNVNNQNPNITLQPTIVIDDVTKAQSSSTCIKETAVI